MVAKGLVRVLPSSGEDLEGLEVVFHGKGRRTGETDTPDLGRRDAGMEVVNKEDTETM